jgi:hypothetical protein
MTAVEGFQWLPLCHFHFIKNMHIGAFLAKNHALAHAFDRFCVIFTPFKLISVI